MKHNVLQFLTKTKNSFVFCSLLLLTLFFLGLSTQNAEAQAFRTTWITTDGATPNTGTITIPTTGTGYNYDITWTNQTNAGVGDGSATGVNIINYQITGLANNDTYEIAITGDFPRFFMNYNFNERGKLRTIAEWGTQAWTSMNNAFSGCSNLTYTATDTPNLSGVTDMAYMFASCTNFNGDIGNWTTTNVTNMSVIFAGATAFNQNIGNWTTTNVTNMQSMFQNATAFNQDIGNWTTTNVTNMIFMFYQATSFNQNIGNWTTTNITNMDYMFYQASAFNQDIGAWNTAAVISMSSMFTQATVFNQDIGNWNISNVIHSPSSPPFSTSMQNMLDNSGLSTANYDATLIGWAAQTVNSGVLLGATGLNYCAGEAARSILTSAPNNWSISGDALLCTPEIAIFGNSTEITNGDTTPSATDNTDLLDGNAPLAGCAPVSKIFTITNQGTTADLILGGNVTISGSANFAITAQPSTFTITAGNSESFMVTYTPTQDGTEIATVSISSNDADESPYTFVVQGAGLDGIQPIIRLYPSTITAECSYTSPTLYAENANIDICGGSPFAGVPNTTFPITTLGTTTVEWTFTDLSGNSTTFLQDITITSDATAPVVPTLTDITAACSVTSLTTPTAPDACAGTITGTTTTTLPITNTSVIIWTFDDGNGNVSTANQNVVITDTQIPTITAPSNVTANTDATLCTASSVALGTPTGTDNCGTPTFTNNAPATFPIGVTTVIWTATDGNGNTATANQTVTISDTKEINLLGNLVSIVDGDTSPDVSDDTDFRNVTTSSVITYTIQNTGTTDLTVSSIDVTGTNNTEFVVSNFTNNTVISGGNTTTFDVTFTPAASGTRTAIITVNNTDCDEGVYDFVVQGTSVNPFRTTWITTDGTITIPTTGTGYNYDITWTNLTNAGVGDGSATGVTINNYQITGLANNDTYEIAITGDFPRFYMNAFGTTAPNYNERLKLRTIEEWGTNPWTSMNSAFYGCSNLTYTATDIPNLSGVTDMSYMFASCTNFNGNIGGWNTTAVINMSSMFSGATSFNQNIENWNTQAVTDMFSMFTFASAFNQNIGNWNTQAVTNMSGMFFLATAFNQDIGNWNISNLNAGTNNGAYQMLDNCGMNTANYDATLIGWAAQTVKPNVQLGASGLKYCAGEAARNTLTSAPNNWVITGDALLCPAPPTFTSTITPVSCAGGSTGAIDLIVSGGTGSATYAWSDGGITTQDRTGLAAGEYSVTISDGGTDYTGRYFV